jgi:esterase/lipase superfamily enzyme
MRAFLREVAEKSGAKEIFLIGHSMGPRGLTAAISAIATTAEREVSGQYKQIILAAADIDRDLFKDHILPAIKTAGMALTLYASDRDKALDLSKIGHSYPRLGSTSPTPFIAEGVVTIDASGVDTSLWGHSYYAENRSIISDMYSLIRNTPIAERFGLQSVDGPHGRYWQFKR